MKLRLLVAAGIVCVSSATIAMAETWNLVDDYAACTNPAGPWTIAYDKADSGYYQMADGHWLTGFGCDEGDLWTWRMGNGLPDLPGIVGNLTGADVFFDNFATLFPTEMLAVHPGHSVFGTAGWDGIIRFTAPSTGLYSIAADFGGLAVNGSCNTHVWVGLNNVNIASGDVTGYVKNSGYAYQYIDTLTLTAGDHVDFHVNSYLCAANTGVAVTITEVPEPATGRCLVAAAIGLLAYISRKRK